MIMTQRIVTASLFAITLFTCPQAHAKDETTVREFLTWERSSQEAFFSISILTAATIATQINPQLANCISQWYSSSVETTATKNVEMLEIMKKYPDLIPTGIVVAVLQKQCGDFG